MKESLWTDLWQFTRPHAFIGTGVQFAATLLLGYTLEAHPTGTSVAIAASSILLIHIFGMGINQLSDIAIDQINKPFLPLASGHFSRSLGLGLSLSLGIIGLSIAAFGGWIWFGCMIALVLALTFYSVPPFRFKRWPLLAALTIACARSLMFSGGLLAYLSQGEIFKSPIDPLLPAFLGFVFLYALVIAVSKDVPDIAGDLHHNIKSLPARLGARRTLNIGTAVVAGLFAGLGLWGFLANHPLLGGGSLLQVIFLGFIFRRLTPQPAHEQIVRYYMGLWKLFYIQLALFAFA